MTAMLGVGVFYTSNRDLERIVLAMLGFLAAAD